MRRDRSVFNAFALADRLNTSIAEIRAMPVEDFRGWQAYFRVLSEKDNQK